MLLLSVFISPIGHQRYPKPSLLPGTPSERISQAAIRQSFEKVARFELQGRKVIALALQLEANVHGIRSSTSPCVIPAGADTQTRKMRPKLPKL
jgi:hypothetical protein